MSAYPIDIKGDLSAPPERGWWLIKWLLAIPHYIILFFLCIAFVFVMHHRLLRHPVYRQISTRAFQV